MSFLFILSTLLIVYFIYTICYLFGASLLKISGINNQNAFTRTFTGVILIPCFFAVYTTVGLSILSAIPVVLLFYSIAFRKQMATFFGEGTTNKIFNQDFIISFLVLTLLYGVHLFYFFDFIENKEITISADYTFYARLASYLRDTGIENTAIELYLDQAKEVVPYHYIEIWFAAFVSKLTGIHSQYALMLVVFPILYTGIYLGAIEIIRVLRKKLNLLFSRIDYFLALLLLITVSCGFLYPTFIPILKSDVWALSVHGTHKIAYNYLFLLSIFLLLWNKKIIETGLMVSILVICQVNVAPAILIAYTLFLLLYLVLKRINWRQFFESMFLPLLSLGYFAIFYALYGGSNAVSLSSKELLAQFDTFQEWKTLINIFGKTLIQILISLLPFIFIYFIYRKGLIKVLSHEIALFTFFAIISGLIAWGIFNQMHDSVQLWGILYNTVINLLIFTLMAGVILLNWNNKVKRTLFILLPLIIFFFHSQSTRAFKQTIQSPETIQTILKNGADSIEGDSNPKFAFIREADEYDNYFQKVEQVYIGHTYGLMRAYDPLIITCISNHLIPVNDIKEERFQKNTTFLKYVDLKRESTNFVSYNKAQIDFVKEFDVDFLLVSKNRQLPLHFTSIFDSESLGSIDGYAVYSRK